MTTTTIMWSPTTTTTAMSMKMTSPLERQGTTKSRAAIVVSFWHWMILQWKSNNTNHPKRYGNPGPRPCTARRTWYHPPHGAVRIVPVSVGTIRRRRRRQWIHYHTIRRYHLNKTIIIIKTGNTCRPAVNPVSMR